MEQNVTYGFGAFRLETNTQLLLYESEHIRLQPKTYRLLLYFLQHPGRLISRDELFDAVWRNRFIEDTALRLAVNALRKALRDDSRTPSYILTACRRGYRFLPEVRIEYDSQANTMVAQLNGLPYQPKTEFSDSAWYYDFALNQLLEAFSQAAEGNRRLVFLNGERGVGKTALLDRFLSKISLPVKTVLRARCVYLSGAFEPFLPLLEALERRCLNPDGRPLIDDLHKIAPTWLYQMPTILKPEDFALLYPNVTQISTGRMLREGAQFIERLGAESIFVLILDNSHWSDEFTLDLLYFLALRCSPTRLLMILSFRPDGDCAGFRRLETMREELMHRGLFRELILIGGSEVL